MFLKLPHRKSVNRSLHSCDEGPRGGRAVPDLRLLGGGKLPPCDPPRRHTTPGAAGKAPFKMCHVHACAALCGQCAAAMRPRRPAAASRAFGSFRMGLSHGLNAGSACGVDLHHSQRSHCCCCKLQAAFRWAPKYFPKYLKYFGRATVKIFRQNILW